MSLKLKYKSKDEIPAAHGAAYVERDGSWCLDVEGVVEESQLDKVLAHTARLEKERDHLTRRLANIQIDEGALAAATRRGMRPTAAMDIAARARAALTLADGLAVVLGEDGKTPRVGKDGLRPMTVDEWVETLTSEAPHLFEGNTGSGAAGNPVPHGSSASRPAVNPYKRESWNLTKQVQLEQEDAAMAVQLRAEAK